MLYRNHHFAACTYLFVLRKRVVRIHAVSVNIVRVNGIASKIIGECDASLDQIMRGLVLDVDPTLVWEFRPDVSEQVAVFRSIPCDIVVAVTSLNQTGAEVADDEDVGVLVLRKITFVLFE